MIDAEKNLNKLYEKESNYTENLNDTKKKFYKEKEDELLYSIDVLKKEFDDNLNITNDVDISNNELKINDFSKWNTVGNSINFVESSNFYSWGG